MGLMTKLYNSLAKWWPLMSAPADYEEEAARYTEHLLRFGDSPARTLLELGSGGGNNASFLKRKFRMTLVDPSPGMLSHSRRLNPECEHHEGDMRTFRLGLGGQFDRVFIHDAICYMTNEDDLRAAVDTAYFHCRSGGAILIAPDFVAETFKSGTECGGHDGPDASLRYLEWCWDPNDLDQTYLVDYVFALRDSSGSIRIDHDRHVEGLFPRAVWLRVLGDAGFVAQNATFEHSEVEYPLELFVGIKAVLRSDYGQA